VSVLSPTFYLYGEAPKAAAPDFLHLEPLDHRSRPAEWHIGAHRHDDLHHVFMLLGGAGEMRAEGGVCRALAPCLVLVPAREVHSFSFIPDTAGSVLTISDVFLEGLCRTDGELRAVFGSARVLATGQETPAMVGYFDRLGRELAWHAPGHAVAVKASLLQILVTALRLECQVAAPASLESNDGRLVARLREQIEARFRLHEPIGAYAASLGVSVSRLRLACRTQGCGAPLDLLNARRMLEAKRALLYGAASVGEIAHALGYEDVSYFVRLFRQMEGVSPSRFRKKSKEFLLF
jgi:AraC family transcriptional activator of pobA